MKEEVKGEKEVSIIILKFGICIIEIEVETKKFAIKNTFSSKYG